MRVCALDEREKELQKQGYVNRKAYFRIGRAIFIVEPVERKLSTEEVLEETLGTPIGVAATLAGTSEKLADDEKLLKQIHEIFMPTGYLKITVEGDPDAGVILAPNQILLSGYRFGLDDVMVDGELVKTTHGSRSEVVKSLAKNLEGELFWTALENNKELESKIKATLESLREIITAIEKEEGES
jgi:hypothetical protein